MLYTDTVEPGTLRLLKSLMEDPFLSGFQLVGGTSLTLRMGFRQSVDLDLFSDNFPERESLEEHLAEKYGFKASLSRGRTLLGSICGVKTDFINYPYKAVRTGEETDGVRMASLQDISAMKLSAIMNDGTRLKDFVDLAYLSTLFSLGEIKGFFEEKFPQSSSLSAIKSMVYFDDIDFAAKIKLTDKDFLWAPIRHRLMDMLRHPYQKFSESSL